MERKKILIVDDSPSVLATLSDILESLGHAAVQAENGEEACRHVETTRFDMIITDLKMPIMDGIEFVKRAKQLANGKLVPMVMLSSEENEIKITEARRVGISSFLKKPIKKGQFTARLKMMLGSASA